MPEEKYTATTAQVIEASANFLNSIKNPLFILLLLVLVGSGYLFYKAIGELIEIKISLAQQNSLVAQQNVLLSQQNKALEDLRGQQTHQHPSPSRYK
jgi:hypothetical protein